MKGIVTLCGPAKFYQEFDRAMLELTKAGWAVFTIGSHRGADSSELAAYRKIFERLHFVKIEASDAIVVINVGGYMGTHTKREIQYASRQGKGIYWLESNGAAPSMHDLLRLNPLA